MDPDSGYEANSRDVNPFAAPTADIGIMPPGLTDVEQIRQRYLKHEASVKSVGILYLVPAGLLTLSGTSRMVMGFVEFSAESPRTILISTAVLGLGCLFLVISLQIRKLRRWPLIPIGILSAIGLLQVPIGTLINGYILWFLFSAKGRYVFSEEYQQVIAATTHMKYRAPVVVIVSAILLIALLLFASM